MLAARIILTGMGNSRTAKMAVPRLDSATAAGASEYVPAEAWEAALCGLILRAPTECHCAKKRSREFQPEFGKAGRFSLDRFLGSRGGGVNFSIGNGLGVAVVVEKKTPGQLTFPTNEPHHGAIRIRSVKLDFSAVPRDENNTLA